MITHRYIGVYWVIATLCTWSVSTAVPSGDGGKEETGYGTAQAYVDLAPHGSQKLDIEEGSGEGILLWNTLGGEHTTPEHVETTTNSASSPTAKHRNHAELSTLRSLESLLSNQQQLLSNIQSQITTLSSRIDEQQMSVDRHDQLLADHSWSIAELRNVQTRSTSDLYTLKSAIISHQTDGHNSPTDSPANSQSTSTSEDTTTASTTTSTATLPNPTSTATTNDANTSRTSPNRPNILASELHAIENRVTDLEYLQTNLASVLKHLISEKVWLNTTLSLNTVKEQEHHVPDNITDTRYTETDVQEIEERTNQVLSSIDKWNKVEQTLHTSLADLHTTHSKYNRELSYLANYSLNNGIIISQLGEARLRDGNTILSLINTTSWFSGQLYQLKSVVARNGNLTDKLAQQMEDNLSQLLQLIQLNSMKVSTVQDAVKGQRTLLGSQLNRTAEELIYLERSLASLSVLYNNTHSTLSEKVVSNKERSDMLWSRMRILDNRLAHVEVKYLTEEVNRYQKTNEELRLSIRLMEMEDQLEVIETNINTQQTNHETLNARLNSVGESVGTLTSSLANMKSEWTRFSDRLPGLEFMYSEVQMMINVLPRDCDDVYSRGVRSSGIKLIKPDKAHPAVQVYCGIDTMRERGWTVLQQRHTGKLSFNRNWTEYKEGFGEVNRDGEFWLGNQLTHTLTTKANFTVRFDMWTLNGSYIYAEYEHFQLLSESEGYRLRVSGYRGNATDSLKHSNNMSFSTIDTDNDMSSMHCALFYTAGWWYKHCQYANLNGRYTVGVVWFNHVVDEWVELSRTRIMISQGA